MFEVRPARSDDVEAAVAMLGDAFARDPLMAWLFGDHPEGLRAGVLTFFSILLRARLVLNMPALVVHRDGEVLGAAMGYDASRPIWPAALIEEWRLFEAGAPPLADRLAAYERICDAFQPPEAHAYLGVIGVHPSLQGQGAGKRLLETFCEAARRDERSHGVYLDTTNPDSLEFYYRNGFELRGEGEVGSTPLWCVWKPS